MFLSARRHNHDTMRDGLGLIFDRNIRSIVAATSGNGYHLRFRVNSDQGLIFNFLNKILNILGRIGAVFGVIKRAGITA